jgi:hypothetical protein
MIPKLNNMIKNKHPRNTKNSITRIQPMFKKEAETQSKGKTTF